MSNDRPAEVDVFLDGLSDHNNNVETENVKEAYETLYDETNSFTNINKDIVSAAVKEDMTVVEEVLRMNASFYSKDSWQQLLVEELPLDNTSKHAFNEVQDKLVYEQFKSIFFEFITDVLGDDLRGGKSEYTHWDVVEARYVVGAGSAHRGQATGDWLEDEVQENVLEEIGLEEGEHFIYVDDREDVTIRGETFQFAKGPDFVIPSLDEAKIIIEAKAYVSSTGSKQSDVLGDVSKLESMVERGLDFYLALDGPMWRGRTADLEELFKKKDEGVVSGIYQIETWGEMREKLEEKLEEYDVDVSSGQSKVGDFQ